MAIQVSGSTVIHDSQDVQVSGMFTASSFVGDASQLTNLPASGGTLEATASGTLADGSKVIVNTDGTVSVVDPSGSSQNITESITSTAVRWDDGTTAMRFAAVYDSTNNRVVICWRSSSPSWGYGKVALGTISGTSITFTTPVNFSNSNIDDVAITFDSHNDRFVIAYKDYTNSQYGTAIVGEINPSTNAITFGTPTVYESANIESQSAVFDSYNNRVVIVYVDGGNSSKGTAVVGEVNPSTNAITFGTPGASTASWTAMTAVAFDSDKNKVILGFGTNSAGYIALGTVNTSNNSINIGSVSTFRNTNTNNVAVAYDTTNSKAVVLFTDIVSNAASYRVVSMDSSGNITFGNQGTIGLSGTGPGNGHFEAIYEPNSNQIVTFFRPGSSPYRPTYVRGSISGTTVNWQSPVEIDTPSAEVWRGLAVDTTNARVIFVYDHNSTTSHDVAKVLQLPYTATATNLTAENFIGVSNGAYSDGQTATIQVTGSVDDAQSGLTAGQAYYVQDNGTLGESGSVFAGTAVSASKIIVKG